MCVTVCVCVYEYVGMCVWERERPCGIKMCPDHRWTALSLSVNDPKRSQLDTGVKADVSAVPV